MLLGRGVEPGEYPEPSADEEECSYRLELNQATAESECMTRERYIENWLETMRDLEDGRFGN